MNKVASTAVYEGGSWKISLQPQHAMLFKRVFDGVEKDGQRLSLSDTPKHARDLLWFSDRYPLDVFPLMRLLAQAEVHTQRERAVEEILSDGYVPTDARLALQLRDYQARAADLAFANGGLLLADDVGLGKAQPLDARVLGPGGVWRAMGELEVGDAVAGPWNLPQTVTGVFPQGTRDVWEVRLEDGRKTRCCDEHLWWCAVFLPGETRRPVPEVLPTSTLRDLLAQPHVTLALPFMGEDGWPRWARVESITAAGAAECRCIAVDSPRHLYVTDDYIVTHNTASAIGLFARRVALPAVVVTLTALPLQWQREVKKFAPELRTHVVKTGKPYPLDRTSDGKRISLPDVTVMSYSKLTTRTGLRNWAEKLNAESMARTVIFDEGQELRNNDSDRYRAARRLREAASYCMLTTATPVYNHGAEIHNVVEIVQPGSLGTRVEFLREWCGRSDTEEGAQTHGTGEMRKIRVKDPIALGSHLRELGVFLRRTRADVDRQLPPLQRVMHMVDVDESVFAETAASLEKLCQTLLYSNNRNDRFTAAGELDWQMRRATGLAKALHVAHFVRMLVESGQKVVLYAWHHEVYDIFRRVFTNPELGDLRPAFYTGRESVAMKDRERARFIDGGTDLFIMSLRAGAGLDGLQHVCKTVVFAELDWSPGVHEQCEGRVFRDGQPFPVMVYYLVTNEGSDPVVLEALNLKTEQSEGIRNLTAEVARLKGSEEHMRKVALAYLRRKGKIQVTLH